MGELTKLYEVTDYVEHYKPTNTKGEDLKYARYVKMPVKPRGKGLRALLKKDRGVEIFGVWALLLEAATETERPECRGKLLNHKDEPASVDEIAESISMEGRAPLIELALSTLSDMGWLTVRSESVLPTEAIRIESDKSSPKRSEEECSGVKRSEPKRSGEKCSEEERSEGECNGEKGSRKISGTKPSPKTQSVGPGISDALTRASISLRFVDACQRELKTVSKSDRKAIHNLGIWLDIQVRNDKLSIGVYDQVMEIAAGVICGKSRNRFAVFFSKLDEDLGYRPRVVKDKEK